MNKFITAAVVALILAVSSQAKAEGCVRATSLMDLRYVTGEKVVYLGGSGYSAKLSYIQLRGLGENPNQLTPAGNWAFCPPELPRLSGARCEHVAVTGGRHGPPFREAMNVCLGMERAVAAR